MFLRILLISALLTSFSFSEVIVDGDELEIKTKNGFETMALYEKGDSSKDISFILLHGKSSKPSKTWYKDLAEELSDKGFEVISPKMPYSKDWRGTFNDALDVIDEIVLFNNSLNKKTVLIGHSLGGATSLIFAASNNEKLAGVIPIAPGHMIHKSKKMQKVTKKSVERAREKVKDGYGDSSFKFKEQNTGKTNDVKMKANIYLSYYDLEKFPNVEEKLENIEIPVLWIAGKSDRLTKVYKMEELFEWLGDNEKNSYQLIKGKHKSVLDNSSDVIINWVNNL